MPPLRTMPTITPTKTERSHEENQERAYIAASRRSDRSLEARIESARRASEIHEKRTGRKLRVTEEDVINEEMYEEEDDNIPWRYRHLALLPNLSTLSPEFRRRVEAQLVLEMERSRMVDPYGQFQSPGPYMNPGMMQMQQPGQQSLMFPSSMFQFGQQTPGLSPQTPAFPQLSRGLSTQQHARSPSTHRQTPYPARDVVQQRVRPSPHQRSASIATPQDLSSHHRQSAHTQTRVGQMEDRRTSLPPQSGVPQSSHSPNNATPPAISRTSSGHTPNSEHSHTSQSQNPSSPMQGYSQFQRHNSFAGPFHGSPNANQGINNPYAPLTPILPLNTQQLLGDGMFNFMDDPSSGMMESSGTGMNQPLYNYNPNGNQTNYKKRKHEETTSSSGLDETLMPTALDTSVNDPGKGEFFNAPFSADSNFINSAVTDPGYGFSFNDDEFGIDLFKSSQGSGQPSLGEFTSFVNDELFGDQQFG